MVLHRFFDSVVLTRKHKSVIATFEKPFRVGSTCPTNGGVRDDLTVVFNHQSCEPVNHDAPLLRKAAQDPKSYHQTHCETIGVNPERSASLCTAASMNNIAVARESYRDLEVVAIATGGVEGNAGRAGDPASYFEADGNFETVSSEVAPVHGTINVILLINKEITKGALSQAMITATEAKSALLQELNVYSRYSKHLATGTGTDQIAIACQLETGTPITSAGKHSKIGELIGKTTHQAVKETLAFQNQLTPRSQCSIASALARFGVDVPTLTSGVTDLLPDHVATLARNNFIAIDRDPITVATVFCLTHIYDKVCWGNIPRECLKELLNLQSAEIAAAVSGVYDHLPRYRKKLEIGDDQVTDSVLVHKVYQAIAMGYVEKWQHLE